MEALGLQWQDMGFEESLIRVRRTWAWGKAESPKNKASKAPVPMHPLLAQFIEGWKCETPYSGSGDWVFPSFKLKGKQPRTANVLVAQPSTFDRLL